MGGERESVVAQTETSDKDLTVVGNVRFHEKNGEFHFHDDENHLKAAVPVATIHEVMDRILAGQLPKWQYPDVGNKTLLHVNLEITEGKKKKRIPAKADIRLKIERMEASPTLEKFHKLIRL